MTVAVPSDHDLRLLPGICLAGAPLRRERPKFEIEARLTLKARRSVYVLGQQAPSHQLGGMGSSKLSSVQFSSVY